MIHDQQIRNEQEDSLAFPSFFSQMEKEGKCKALPLKYVLMFEDEEINKNLQVIYSTSKQEFSVNFKGQFFKGRTLECKSYREMLNTVKLRMISEKFSNPEIFEELWYIVQNPLYADKKFEELADKFWDRIVKTEIEFSEEELAALNITKTVKAGHKYNI